MKKSLSIISSALLLSAMLAACNTDTEQPTNTSANETTEAESTKTETATTEATEETVNEQTAEQGEQPSGDTTSSEKTELTYTSKGEAVTEKTITSTSDELGYSISHLESYTLESEEPGVDHLFSNADDALSMQIKVASTEETTFDDMSASTKETITAIASEGNYEEVDLTNVKAATPSINNVIGYETVLDSEKITIVTFEKGAKIITLTIYDTEEADLTDAFLNMGLTIQ
jgi:hypothetical protein